MSNLLSVNTKTVEEVAKPRVADVAANAAEASMTAPSEQPSIRYASDEDVRHASEKVFRLHARLFEALAK